MAVTTFSNLIEPRVFAQYVQEMSTKTSRFVQAGILANDPVLGNRLLDGGRMVDIPLIGDLGGETNEWNDNQDITAQSLSTNSAQAMKMYEYQAYAATDWGQLATGAPVIKQIAERFGAYWVRKNESWLISVLNSAFANADIAETKGYKIGAETLFSPADMIAATVRMGDVADPTLQKIVVNSATLGELRKQNLIAAEQPSEAGMVIRMYNGLNVIVDDEIPVDATGKTSAFMFAPSSVYFATATPANGIVVNRDELKNGGSETIINKRVMAMQLAGTSVDLSVAQSADEYRQAVLDGKAAYKIASDPRQIGVVKYAFKVSPEFIVAGINSPKKAASTTTTSGSAK